MAIQLKRCSLKAPVGGGRDAFDQGSKRTDGRFPRPPEKDAE